MLFYGEYSADYIVLLWHGEWTGFSTAHAKFTMKTIATHSYTSSHYKISCLRATHVAIIKNMKQDVLTWRSLSTAGYRVRSN